MVQEGWSGVVASRRQTVLTLANLWDHRVLENVAGRDVIVGRHPRQCRGDERHVEAAGGLLRN
jgi:hypothetical protein